MNDNEVDVIIIGAGFAGLAAALELKKSNVKTIIIEARQRPGGRVKTYFLPYDMQVIQVPFGGQWIGPGQDYMYELAKKYHATIFPTMNTGKSVIKYNNKIINNIPDRVNEICEKIDNLSSYVNLYKPWETPDAEKMDSETFSSWLNKETSTKEEYDFISRYIAGSLLAKEAAMVSLLQVLFYVKSGNGIKNLLSIKGGAQQDRIMGGLEYIAKKMAEDFERKNIIFNHPVRKIGYSENYANIYTNNKIFSAKKVICAIPLATVNNIEFCPELPVLKQKCFAHILAPSAFKSHFIYKTPFWYEQELSGNAVIGSGYIHEIYNNSIINHKHGILSLFSYGAYANKLRGMTKNERKYALKNELFELFGENANYFIDYLEYDWSEKVYTRGCFSSHFGLNGLYSLGNELNKNTGALYWAGSEFSAHWNGYCEGAVRSGIETAKKIISDLD